MSKQGIEVTRIYKPDPDSQLRALTLLLKSSPTEEKKETLPAGKQEQGLKSEHQSQERRPND